MTECWLSLIVFRYLKDYNLYATPEALRLPWPPGGLLNVAG